MIIEEYLNETCVRHYSDQNLMIRQVETDTLWPDAIDVIPCPFTYEETDIPIEDEEISAEEALDILMGGA